MNKIRAFGAFWYDFIIGDDWTVAVGVAVALALTYALSQTSVSSWWLLPVAIAIGLPITLIRATRRK